MINLKQKDKSVSFQDLMNNLISQAGNVTEDQYLKEIDRIENELCLVYDANFKIKTEKFDDSLYSTVYLNDVSLINFAAKI